MHCRAIGVWIAGVLLLTTGCGTDAKTPAQTVERPSDPASVASSPPATSSEPTRSVTPTPSNPPAPKKPQLGVDVSHHKGSIDWRRVAADGITFAYLKATEGKGFTDPRFAENLRGAQAAGLRAGGYHYFTLCGSGAPQAAHYLSVIGSGTTMPPAVDVEFIGNCNPGPSRPSLLRELRAFIDAVEAATGQDVVVYLYPEIEEHYRLAGELDRRQWVRSLEGKPARDWWIWQKSDSARIDGISSPADLNQMR